LDIPLISLMILGSLILLSAFFSSAETAYSSVNKIRLKNFLDEGRKGSKKANYIVENFDQALSTILVGNNIVNIAATSISTKLAIDMLGDENSTLAVSTVVMTILILTFGEILPKSIAKENAESYTLTISGVLFVLIKILSPVNYVFSMLKNLVSRFFSNDNQLPSVTEEEIKVMVNISEEEGVINKDERELIHRSMDFDEILTGEILTPRIDMIAIEVNWSIEEIKNIFFEEKYSRVPVYENHSDNIIGILSEKEFFSHLLKFNDVNIRGILREPMFVVESMKISVLLPQLQKNKVHMAIVLDEYGGTAGLITLEDVLEELVGEIWDEQDEKINVVSKISDTLYKFDAQFPLEDFAELMKISIPESAYHTLGGWIIEQIGAIPANGDSFPYEGLVVSIEEVINRRIKKISVEVQEKIGVEDSWD